ncbi:MAG: class D sortase [Chloroflexi bacterium]|nr:class D sortase [Chloroflexota bacterium]
MARKIRPEDISEAELRRLLIEKRRAAHKKRLDEFRSSGRVVELAPNTGSSALEDMRSKIIGEPFEESAAAKKTARRKRFFDRLLLAVEVLAIGGLVFIMFNGASLLQTLNSEVASALELPTLTPTPLVRVVVLPSGHTSPNSPGGARPNDAEIPEHLRPLVQSLPEIDLPTPSPEQATRIQINNIDVDVQIVQGVSWEQLKRGVGQYVNGINPGQDGNLILSAHNDIFGQFFRFLDQLAPGDEVVVFTNLRAYTYVITGTLVVEPTFVQVMEQTTNPSLTLISCYPYLIDDQRIVVQALLIDS